MEGTVQETWNTGTGHLFRGCGFLRLLLAGQGSAPAMVAAYILAGELRSACGDYTLAFTRYQGLFSRPFVLTKQKAALRFAGTFAPRSRFALFFRNQVMNLMSIPWIADLAMGRDLADNIALPETTEVSPSPKLAVPRFRSPSRRRRRPAVRSAQTPR